MWAFHKLGRSRTETPINVRSDAPYGALGWPSPVSFPSPHVTTPRRGVSTARAIRPIQIRAMAFPPWRSRTRARLISFDTGPTSSGVPSSSRVLAD